MMMVAGLFMGSAGHTQHKGGIDDRHENKRG
jgi:hypothetical protein